MPYTSTLFAGGLEPGGPRQAQGKDTVTQFLQVYILPSSTSCLHKLLPPARDPELLSRFRAPSKYPGISNRTKVGRGSNFLDPTQPDP